MTVIFYPIETLKEFKAVVSTDEEILAQMKSLREDVNKFSLQFPLPGLDKM